MRRLTESECLRGGFREKNPNNETVKGFVWTVFNHLRRRRRSSDDSTESSLSSLSSSSSSSEEEGDDAESSTDVFFLLLSSYSFVLSPSLSLLITDTFDLSIVFFVGKIKTKTNLFLYYVNNNEADIGNKAMQQKFLTRSIDFRDSGFQIL